MCASCIFWQRRDREFGVCRNEKMAIRFTPFTEKPVGFDGSLEQYNARQRPAPNPLTTADYRCPNFTSE